MAKKYHKKGEKELKWRKNLTILPTGANRKISFTVLKHSLFRCQQLYCLSDSLALQFLLVFLSVFSEIV